MKGKAKADARGRSMSIRTVKVSDKGQIAIPADVRASIGLEKGDELVLLQDGGRIMLQKTQSMTARMRGEFDYMVKNSERVFSKLWGGKKDDAWDNA